MNNSNCEFFERTDALATPVTKWAEAYLDAVMRLEDENVRLRTAWRQNNDAHESFPEVDQGSELWHCIWEAAQGLDAHGLPGSTDAAMLQDSGVIARLLSIRHNRGVGYAFSTGWQVLAVIMQTKLDRRWHTLFSIAVKAYDLQRTFTWDQSQKYALWRQKLIERVKAGDEAYLRPDSHDALISILFPEMAQGLANGFGRKKEKP